MSRYIDAEICRRRISDERTDDKRWNEALNRACRIVCDQPTVDAVPVVRCQECKHSSKWYGDKCRCFLWSKIGIDVFDDGFCSYGEKVTE